MKYEDEQLCGCVTVWPCDCVAVWLCGSAAVCSYTVRHANSVFNVGTDRVVCVVTSVAYLLSESPSRAFSIMFVLHLFTSPVDQNVNPVLCY
ncbi:hypothetical protein PoB_002324100 [Plakobranchus ocellatus]|uniref:Uncharacterized protein n=1 Tax=Plakobranchus ocellatus TaxID=259542 RepID=A0AAV3ZLC4_9GAST|nr:hypothetical protein PoB_002324100 [Plakobranchus ocellatus]